MHCCREEVVHLRVRIDKQRLVYVADNVLQPLHLEHPNWLPAYDIIADKAAANKQQVFHRAAVEHALVLGQHFPPFPSLGYVTKQNVGWRWEKTEGPYHRSDRLSLFTIRMVYRPRFRLFHRALQE